MESEDDGIKSLPSVRAGESDDEDMLQTIREHMQSTPSKKSPS